MDMNVRSVLMEGGVNVDELLERCMGSEALLARLLKKFPLDSSFAGLEDAFRKSDETAALEASHTLKGVCGNLSLTGLFTVLDRQVQLLRSHDMSGAASIMPEISRQYYTAIQSIEKAFG